MDLYVHCKDLYEHTIRKMMSYDSLSHMNSFFTIESVSTGIKKLAPRKGRDLQCIKVEMLIWKGKKAHEWISYMFNHG